MPSIDLIKVLDLLTRANDHGVRVSLNKEKLSIKYPRSKKIDQELLGNLKSHKDHLIEYFQYYDKEFKDVVATDSHSNAIARFESISGYNEPRKVNNSHLLLLNTGENGLPVFVVPGSGGKSGGYQILANGFTDAYSIYGLEMIGTQKGETPLKTVQEIALQNIRWLRQVQPEGPYRLIGHSFGAYIMFEMTRQLEALGQKLDFIVVLDQQMELKGGLDPGVSEADFVMELTRDYFESFKIIYPPYPEWALELRGLIEEMPMEEMVPFIAGIISEKLPHAAKVIEYVARLVNIRAHNDTMPYFPWGKLNTEAIVFRAADNDSPDESLGWHAFTDRVSVITVPSDHHYMIKDESAIEIAKHLMQRIQN
jgi:thioesterase domain-containing protein